MCSCCSVDDWRKNGAIHRRASMVGGCAKIQWREDGEVVINAPAELVYEGEWLAPVVT